MGLNTKISSILLNKETCFSLEINSNRNSRVSMEKAFSLNPDFVAVTWIGNFENVPHENIPAIKLAKELILKNQNVLLHVPARNFSKKEASEILETIKSIGVRNLLALKGQSDFIKEKDDSKADFPFASHFVRFVREKYGDYFDIGVTGYPEKHRQSCDYEDEMKYLKQKVDEGASFIVTQACFDFGTYKKFHEKCIKYSINIPIFLGLFILSSAQQCEMLKKFCKISVNPEITSFVENNKGDSEKIQNFGKQKVVEIASLALMQRNSFSGIHIFSSQHFNLMKDVFDELRTIKMN